jgi:hypothetical protein
MASVDPSVLAQSGDSTDGIVSQSKSRDSVKAAPTDDKFGSPANADERSADATLKAAEARLASAKAEVERARAHALAVLAHPGPSTIPVLGGPNVATRAYKIQGEDPARTAVGDILSPQSIHLAIISDVGPAASSPGVTDRLVVERSIAQPTRASVTLAVNSPFSAESLSEAKSDGRSIELRGIMGGSELKEYCIYDSKRGKCFWTGLGETGYPDTVIAEDMQNESVRVQTDDGRIYDLKLVDSKISSASLPSNRTGPSVAMSEPPPAALIGDDTAPDREQSDEVKAMIAKTREEIARRHQEALDAWKSRTQNAQPEP